MPMLRGFLAGDFDGEKPQLKDIGLSCLYFIFKRKDECLKQYLISNKKNLEMLADFLRIAKSNEHDLKKSFLVAIRELLAIKIPNKEF